MRMLQRLLLINVTSLNIFSGACKDGCLIIFACCDGENGAVLSLQLRISQLINGLFMVTQL